MAMLTPFVIMVGTVRGWNFTLAGVLPVFIISLVSTLLETFQKLFDTKIFKKNVLELENNSDDCNISKIIALFFIC